MVAKAEYIGRELFFLKHSWGYFFGDLTILIKFSLLNNEYKKYTILKTTTELQNAKHPNKCHYTLLSLKPPKLQIIIETFLFCCFWTSEFGRAFLKSVVSFTFIALSFLSSYWNMASLDCSYRASKSRRNTDMEGGKRIATFPLTFTFAASARYCRLYLQTQWMLR